jgi:hypothetical protein
MPKGLPVPENWRERRDDLSELRSNGEPICTPTSKMTAQVATAEEIVALRDVAHAKSNGDKIVITYLVELDSSGRYKLER